MSDLFSSSESSRLPLAPQPSGGLQGLAPQPAFPIQQPLPEPEGGLDWRRWVSAILRHKWLILTLTALGAGMGFVMSRRVSPVYMAEATVWVESQRRNREAVLGSGQLLDDSRGWIDLLNSYAVLDHTVEALRLYLRVDLSSNRPMFDTFRPTDSVSLTPGVYMLAINNRGDRVTLSSGEGIVLEEAQPGDSIGRDLGFAWVPAPSTLRPGAEVRFSVNRPRDVARGLADRLDIETGGNRGFLRVQLRGSNPRSITATVNAVVDRFVELAAELKRLKLVEVETILGEQLRASERKLRSAEDALQRLQAATITLPSRENTPLVGGLESAGGGTASGGFFALRIDRDAYVRDRAAIGQALAGIPDSGLSVTSLEFIGSVQRSTELSLVLQEYTTKQAELRALRYRYTDAHPLVRRLLDQIEQLERVTVPALLGALASDLDARIGELDSRMALTSRELQQIPAREIEQARLQREVAVADNLYTLLSRQYEEARLAEASAVPDVRVLDRAIVPRRPVSVRGGRYILMGFVGGFGLSVLGAILLDRADRRVRYPDQVTLDLGLPLLGVVPQLKKSRNGDQRAIDVVLEAIRGVRLNLVHAAGASGPLVVTVTSAGPGDGKSFVAANLALSFAEAGHRTLLVDGDSRRGTLHRVMDAQRKPGLTDVLAGQAEQAVGIQKTGYPMLDFVGCGTRTTQAPELLGSAAMTEAMTSLKSSYGVIIMDSPPLGAGIDAFALGTVTGNVLVVFRLGVTDRELAEAKLDVLDRLPVRVLGAVLNDVPETSAYRYYKYYSYYLPGYEHEDEDPAERRSLLKGPAS